VIEIEDQAHPQPYGERQQDGRKR